MYKKSPWFISDRSGFRFPYDERVKESTGMVVHISETDGAYDLKNHPQNRAPRIGPRRILWDARPEVSVTANPTEWNPSMTTFVSNLNEVVYLTNITGTIQGGTVKIRS
jgi:hypothetical protein